MDGKEAVWEKVEAFRDQYLTGELSSLPVDVFALAELELKLDVIPFNDLAAKFQSEAAITLDFSGLYVDAETYVYLEKGPAWKLKRLRFSVAHELGHYVLHRDKVPPGGFASFQDFADWTQSNGGSKYTFEQEANEFAGRLLVPVDRLQEHYDQLVTVLDAQLPNWCSSPSASFRDVFADQIAERFGVNQQVIEMRLDREGIWPAE